jgi:peptidoglycan hydrolase-like protein with peptidoglycan-binding domain
LTQAAVKAFQQKYGISATGLVGPLTRAELNSINGGRVLGANTTGTAALQAEIAQLQAQLLVLLQQLAAMLKTQK